MKYNTAHYNDQRYNIDGIFHTASLVETITEVDGTQLADLLKSLSDSMAFTDSLTTSPDVALSDFMFIDEMVQIQFTNKALSDVIRLADWLSIERSPAENGWYD